MTEKDFHHLVGGVFLITLGFWSLWAAWPSRTAQRLIRPPGVTLH